MRSTVNLPDEMLGRMVDSIASAVPTDSVYIFGSYARGEEGPDSDVDIYVVTSDEAMRPLACAGRIRRALLWMPQPRDVMAAPKRLFEERSREFWKVEARVAEEGVKIYEALQAVANANEVSRMVRDSGYQSVEIESGARALRNEPFE